MINNIFISFKDGRDCTATSISTSPPEGKRDVTNQSSTGLLITAGKVANINDEGNYVTKNFQEIVRDRQN